MALAAMTADRCIHHDRERGIEYVLRPYRGTPDDPLIFSTWCGQIRRFQPFSGMNGEQFDHYRARVLEPLVARCGVLFAASTTEPDVHVYGWACGEHRDETQVLHMLYVRSPFRRHGIATTLLRVMFPAFKRKPLHYTHRAKATRYREAGWLGVYDHYLVMEP